jgi:hypothetical protein
VVNDVICYLVALFDAGVFVKLPMHAHKDAAPCIVIFRSAKRWEDGWPERPQIAVNFSVLAVMFVRDKSELRMGIILLTQV